MQSYIGAIFWLFTFLSFSQDLPPIIQYSYNQYGGGSQNWMLSQNEEKHVFVANNEGLLHFSGEKWRLYPSPNETILRSVKCVGNKIYTGAYMEFGYWSFDNQKELVYTSLSDQIKGKIIEDEQFWGIIEYDQWMLFQSLDRIYLYNTNKDTFEVIDTPSGILKIFKSKETVLFQSNDNSLYEIRNGTSHLVSADVNIKKNRIINVFDHPRGHLLHTRNNGFYLFKDGEISKWNTETDELLSSVNAYSSIQLENKNIVIGTIAKGVILLNSKGELVNQIRQVDGLGNNTVLSLLEDTSGNLWAGLDNGINCVNLKSAIRTFNDDSGILGTVYASMFHNENLYVGTNQGLFVKLKNGARSFKLIEGTGGQVWSLFTHDNTLFCGHDFGTFIIENGKAALLNGSSGTWHFSAVKNKPEILLQGGYNGFSVLRKFEDKWIYSNKIKDFNLSSKHFELLNDNEAFMSHEYKGVFKILFDKDYKRVISSEELESPIKGKDASLVKYNDNLYYFYREGIFKYHKKEATFYKDTLISNIFKDDKYISGKMVVTEDNRLWLFSRNKIIHITPGKLSKEPVIDFLFIPLMLRQTTTGYENVTLIDDQTFLFGANDGYFLVDLSSYKISKGLISINKIVQKNADATSRIIAFDEEAQLPFKNNTIAFEYGTPIYDKYSITEYQYYLEPYNESWSKWSEENHINFDNLPFGEYTFKVRSRCGKNLSENVASFRFTVLKPWALSTKALVLYFILFVLLGFLIHYAYRSYYRKQEAALIEENSKKLRLQQLANEQEIVKMRNQQLRQDIESKNRELAVSTMNLINKNEILGQIKKSLKVQEEKGVNLKSVLRIIDQNINEEDNWNIFKDAFNNADKDFLKKVKKKHPALTPNDLRLCAYLRLNLSSKEIAPLLNISPRSVEIKRYRLRKKMELVHEKSLVEYILEI
ncbi:triple tyrosine motif-containing protein [Ascidiimonas sp. W6]|uniref:triple tyrosine motif-containing protein n=1 Tax=Ascidiimonas meishanensis TaxID=3128903 RepID=UPI0030ECF9A3